MSLRLRVAGVNFLVGVCVSGPPPLLPGVRWPFAGVWRAGAAPSSVCNGLFWLDPRLASLALVLWCAVVRRAAPCRVSPCCLVVVRAVLRCAPLGRAVLRRVVPWCGAPCRVASCRVMACCALGYVVLVRCTVARCGAVCSAASFCAVVGRWRSVWPVSLCGVRVGVWLADGWGVRLRVGWLVGSVLWGSGCAARAGGSVRCPQVALLGGLCFGPVSSWGPGL